MKFFNREEEIKEILHILNKEPNDIYFIYGSINSGKTTLINHIINNELKKSNKKLDENQRSEQNTYGFCSSKSKISISLFSAPLRYAVFYVNFREYDISSMNNFVEALFEIDENSKSSKIKPYIESFTKGLNDIINISYGIKVPKPILDRLFGEEEKGRLVFKFIRDLFMSLNDKGIQPIFILDELQMIKEVSMNGGRPLLKSFFQFLVSLTKERHLAHCLCLTSDSLFAEYVYNTGELEGRAKHLLVDDFDKPTAIKFMDFLAKENNIKLSNEQKELIYSYVGGKPKDIAYVVEESSFKGLNEVLDYLLNDEIQKLDMKFEIMDYLKPKVEIGEKIVEIEKEEILKSLNLFKDKYDISKKEIPTPVYIYLIRENILFLNPQNGTLKPQSFLIWNAIKKII